MDKNTIIYPAWEIKQIITPDEAADTAEAYGLHAETLVYRTPRVCQPFIFDGCSAINNFLRMAMPPEQYWVIVQNICRPHDIVYGVCTSSERRRWADEKFRTDLLATGFLSESLCNIAYRMVREFGASNKTWGPGFALSPEFKVEVW